MVAGYVHTPSQKHQRDDWMSLAAATPIVIPGPPLSLTTRTRHDVSPPPHPLFLSVGVCGGLRDVSLYHDVQ